MRIDELKIKRGTTIIGPLTHTFSHAHINVITGISGVGKTSLCLALAGFIKPLAGHIATQNVALVAQNPREWLNPRLSVRQVLAHAARATGNRVDLASILGQTHIPAALCNQPCAYLSGGQAARVALARALATSWPIIVCDEPTAALDSSQAAKLLQLLLKVAESGKTIVWATHEIDLARAFGLLQNPTHLHLYPERCQNLLLS